MSPSRTGSSTGSNVTLVELPDFKNTEEALRFGQFITRDQFIFLAGARAALKREFRRETDLPMDELDAGRQILIATKLQLIRECLEVAPDKVLASLIDSGISIDGPDPEVPEEDGKLTASPTGSNVTLAEAET